MCELFHSTPDQMIMNLEEQAGGQFVFPVNNVTFSKSSLGLQVHVRAKHKDIKLT